MILKMSSVNAKFPVYLTWYNLLWRSCTEKGPLYKSHLVHWHFFFTLLLKFPLDPQPNHYNFKNNLCLIELHCAFFKVASPLFMSIWIRLDRKDRNVERARGHLSWLSATGQAQGFNLIMRSDVHWHAEEL